MMDLAAALALRARLPRAWPAFFERHGAFTTVQLAAIPPLLDGANVIVGAPTASGKTEAAVAPLIERHCPPTPALHPPPVGPAILYLTPTRALANDLAARLTPPLAALGLALGIRTRDQRTLRPDRPPALLLTTPESLDSLLAGQARLLTRVRAVVVDEIHLFDGTPRGDQLRVLLNRLRRLREAAAARGDADDGDIQYAALSATLADPAAVAARYFPAARVIQAPGRQPVEVEQIDLDPDDPAALLAYLDGFRARGWRKGLAFCNSRAEVEAYAAIARERSPFGGAVFVHYSNIEARRRREIERQFAAAGAALCFASSTLELGIDIGSIDIVLLIGPPGDPGSFVQRLGRANRRRQTRRVACFARDALERRLFEALALPDAPPAATAAPFRPAVAIQQIFSLLKQSPTGGVRLAELAALFAGLLEAADLEQILGGLQQRDYLAPGRPGEWRPGGRLNDLYDRQGWAHVPLSIFSNIQGSEGVVLDVRDQHTGQTVARVDAAWLAQERPTLEGRPVTVEWYDGEAAWVTSAGQAGGADRPPYRSERQLLSHALARRVPLTLGLPADTAPFVRAPDGCLWFHCLGDLYGHALLDLLRYRVAARPTANPGLALHLPGEPPSLPMWTEARVGRALHDADRFYQQALPLGPYQRLLPLPLRRRSVVEQFDIPGFLTALAGLRPVAAPEDLAGALLALLGEEDVRPPRG